MVVVRHERLRGQSRGLAGREGNERGSGREEGAAERGRRTGTAVFLAMLVFFSERAREPFAGFFLASAQLHGFSDVRQTD